MVASRQVEIPFYRCIGRQRGQGFFTLPQIIGRASIHFLRNNTAPALKRVGVDLLEFVLPEIADVASGRNISRQQQRVREEKK